jgi:hypothetical protein
MERREASKILDGRIESNNKFISKLQQMISKETHKKLKKYLEHIITYYKVTNMVWKSIIMYLKDDIPLHVEYMNRLKSKINNELFELMEMCTRLPEGQYLDMCDFCKKNSEEINDFVEYCTNLKKN